MNKYILCLFLFSTILARGQAHSVAKKVTLGDLLKKAKEESRGSKTAQIEKNTIAVPSAQAVFKVNKDVNLNIVKPPKLSEIYRYGDNDQVAYEKALNLQIDELYKLTQKFNNNSNRGELWLRLAELYVEKANIEDSHLQDAYDKKLREFLSGKIKIKPVLDLEKAKAYNRNAIQLYDWFLRDFPTDPKVSQALFFLGYNNYEIGNAQAGAQYYAQLKAKFPTSEFTGEAHFTIGETNFENEKWAEAYKEYSFLIKNNKHNLHTMALYKAAWCLYRLGRTEDGIKYLDFIIRSSHNEIKNSSEHGKKINNARLENEAIKDLVIFFADINDITRAINYFKNLNSKESFASIEKLAYYLSNKGNYESSREVFRYLILHEPLKKKSFEYQYQIVQDYFFTKNSSDFRTELYRWVKGYNVKSDWAKANKNDENYLAKCDLQRELTLRNYVLQLHQAAQSSHAVYAKQAAAEAYKLYFEEFSKFTQAGEMHFFYGELLYDMTRFNEAAAEYWTLANEFPDNKYVAKAAQNILLAREKSIPKDEEFQKNVGNSIAPIALDQKIIKFIEASDWYLKKFPKADRAAEIRFRVGRIYYLTNNFSLAEKRFKEIVQKHPNTKFLDYSANLLLDMYSLKNDYAGLEKIGLELLAEEAISGTKMAAEIKGVLEKASFKQAQSLELQKKYLESANQFQIFSQQNEKSELVGIAYFNAAINFERSGKNKEAINNYKKVILYQSASVKNLRPKAKRLLAKLYQDSGLFAETAQLYSELTEENPSDPLFDSYLYNSAVMYEITADNPEAIKRYINYLRISKNKNESATVLFKVAQLQRESNQLRQAIDSYRKYTELANADTSKKIEALYWIYDLSIKQRIKTDIGAAEANIRKLFLTLLDEKKDGVAGYLAKINLIQAQTSFSQLKSILIPANAKKQKIAVGKKLELMNRLNIQLGNIIKLNSAEEIIGALYILGESNEHMAQAFSAVPVPAALNAEQKNLYLTEIEKIITPFIQKSDESYKSAIEKGSELQTYGEAYNNSFNKMNMKYPQQFYYSGELISDSKIIDWVAEND